MGAGGRGVGRIYFSDEGNSIIIGDGGENIK